MIVAIAGIDGAGKSSLTRALRDWLLSQGVDCTLIDKWDIFDTERFPECRFVGGDRRALCDCIVEMSGFSRSLFLFWLINACMPKDEQSYENRVLLLDGYWMKHAAAEQLAGCDPEWLVQTAAQMPPCDLVILLDVDPRITIERKGGDLLPYECGVVSGGTPQDFVRHQQELSRLLREWGRARGWETVSAEVAPERVLERAKDILGTHLRRCGLP
jgi:thymidylate kinase